MFYSVKKSGDKVVVESQNAKAKQVFFGWGSDQSAIDGSFYGREVTGSWGPNHELRWRWVLTPGAVEVMLKNLHLELTDPNYKDKAQERAVRELKLKLERFSRRKILDCMTEPHGQCEHAGYCVEHKARPSVEPCAFGRRPGNGRY